MEECAPEEAYQNIYPERVVLVVTWDRENKRPNVMPAGWGMRTSHSPPMFAVSVGHTRHTHKLLKDQGEFVLAVSSIGMEDEILNWGTKSGRDTNKLKGTETENAKTVKPPLLPEAVINLECKAVGEFDTGDHTIFVGRVQKAYKNKDAKLLLNFGDRRFRASESL